MKNKEYVINKLHKTIGEIEKDYGLETGELDRYYEDIMVKIRDLL